MRSRDSSAVAPLKIENSFDQVRAPEIGPKRLGNIQLGIRDLPKQKVADPHLAGSANEQVRIRRIRRIEI